MAETYSYPEVAENFPAARPEKLPPPIPPSLEVVQQSSNNCRNVALWAELLAEVCQNLAGSGQFRVGFGERWPIWANFGKLWPNSAKIRPNFDRH